MSGALRVVVVVAVVMMMVQLWWPAVYSMTSEERKGSMAALLIKAHVCVCARACAFVDSGRWPHPCGVRKGEVAYRSHCTRLTYAWSTPATPLPHVMLRLSTPSSRSTPWLACAPHATQPRAVKANRMLAVAMTLWNWPRKRWLRSCSDSEPYEPRIIALL
jgi:hypothetical protein